MSRADHAGDRGTVAPTRRARVMGAIAPIGAAALLCASAEAAERRMAVVIGADHGDADEAALTWAEADARRVADVLVELAGVAPDELVHLERARAADVREVLSRVAARAAAEPADQRSMLVVYVSGHADATSLHLSGTRMLLTELQDLVEAVPVDTRVLVLDACRAGELTRARGGTPVAPFEIVVEDRLASRGTAILTAAAAGEDAQESDRLAGGVFTHHLVAGLRGAADSTGDLRVSLDEIYRYTYARTLETTATAPTLQHPSFSFDLTGQREVVLTSLDRGERDGSLRFDLAGDYLIFDEHGREVRYDLAVAEGGVLSLDPGRYMLRRRTPAAVWEGLVMVTAGATTAVGEADLSLLPFGQATRRGGDEDTARASLSMFVGGGVAGPLLPELGLQGVGNLGLRLDTPELTVRVEAHGGRSAHRNDDLLVRTTAVGGSVQLLRMFDGGPVSFGPGLGFGLDGVFQGFETQGSAPPVRSFAGRVGALARLEVSLHPRATLGVQGALDAAFLRASLPRQAGRDVVTTTVPQASLDLTVWLAQAARARRAAGGR